MIHYNRLLYKYINTFYLPINCLNFKPCISTLQRNPSAIQSASILVAPFFQFKKHLCVVGDFPMVLALSQIIQYRFLIPINNIFFVRNPIIVACREYQII